MIREGLVDLEIYKDSLSNEFFSLKKANLHFDENHILVPLKKGFLYLLDLSLGPETEQTDYKIQLYSPDMQNISSGNMGMTFMDKTI